MHVHTTKIPSKWCYANFPFTPHQSCTKRKERHGTESKKKREKEKETKEKEKKKSMRKRKENCHALSLASSRGIQKHT
jgi:hypothetical protein